MEFSIANICRTCMNDENELCSIYTMYEAENKTFADLLMMCASVKVLPDDGLPEVICVLCKEQLTASFNFKIQSEQIDATLREVTINPNVNEVKEEIDASDEENKEESLDSILDSNKVDNDNNDIIMGITYDDTDDKKSQDDEINSIETEKSDDEKPEYFQDEDIITEEEYLAMEAADSKMHTCEKCSKIFTRLGSYLTHRKRYCLDSYSCIDCDLIFPTKCEYRRHRKNSHYRKVYKCELCNKIFRSSHGLSYHVKIHTGVKEYECPYKECGKKFTLKQAMQKHISTHQIEVNFLCYICGKMYGTWDALHYHIKTHDGQRPHVCEQCGKGFKQSCHLKSHMWIHSGVKPHECSTCGKCYTSGHQLKKHQQKSICQKNIMDI